MDDFARRLKECREQRKRENGSWTQKYVAEKIGMARTTYTAYENGTKMPPPDTINNIAILLDVSNDYLMGRTNIPGSYDHLIERSTKQFTFLPVVANIASESVHFTQAEIIEYFPANRSLLGDGEYVWLKTTGDSMINAGIKDGSKVLISLQTKIENGDIAAICIDCENAILKKVYYSEENITLVSENSSYTDQVYHKSRITFKGKAVYVGSTL